MEYYLIIDTNILIRLIAKFEFSYLLQELEFLVKQEKAIRIMCPEVLIKE